MSSKWWETKCYNNGFSQPRKRLLMSLEAHMIFTHLLALEQELKDYVAYLLICECTYKWYKCMLLYIDPKLFTGYSLQPS